MSDMGEDAWALGQVATVEARCGCLIQAVPVVGRFHGGPHDGLEKPMWELSVLPCDVHDGLVDEFRTAASQIGLRMLRDGTTNAALMASVLEQVCT